MQQSSRQLKLSEKMPPDILKFTFSIWRYINVLVLTIALLLPWCYSCSSDPSPNPETITGLEIISWFWDHWDEESLKISEAPLLFFVTPGVLGLLLYNILGICFNFFSAPLKLGLKILLLILLGISTFSLVSPLVLFYGLYLLAGAFDVLRPIGPLVAIASLTSSIILEILDLNFRHYIAGPDPP